MDRVYYPEDKLPPGRLLPLAAQHVVAMFGATVLAPVIMGFDSQLALFFSGIGTLIFVLCTGGKVPSYLGSSFAFIGPVLAVTGGKPENIPFALCGIASAAVLYMAAAAYTLRLGSGWIDRLMPPVVTGSVVALIGLNLAGSALDNALNGGLAVACGRDALNLTVACVTFVTASCVSIYAGGLLRLLPILSGVIAGCAFAAFTGAVDPAAWERILSAPWFGVPHFQTPSWSAGAIVAIAPVFIVLVAENKGHLEAISSFMGRDLNRYLGRAYLGDAAATFVSACGGGTPQTTYAENMGVMAITRVFSVYNFIAAACIAILLGLCPKFGALVHAIPHSVLGGVSIVLFGLIAMMGVKIWVDARVDFCQHRNLVIAGSSIIVATGLGARGLTVYGLNVSGIALGTLMAVVLNILLAGKLGLRGSRQDSEVCS